MEENPGVSKTFTCGKEMKNQERKNLHIEEMKIPEHPGYDFLNAEMFEDFTCAICLDPCLSAIVTSCSHYFCAQCFAKTALTKCPVCKQELKPNDARKLKNDNENDTDAYRPIRNLFSKVAVQCRVCKEKLQRGFDGEHFQQHVEKHCPVECPFGCQGLIFTREALPEHQYVCPHIMVSCQAVDLGCDIYRQRANIAEHEKQCVRVSLAPLFRSLQSKVSQLEDKLALILPSTPLTISNFLGDYLMTTYGPDVPTYVSTLIIYLNPSNHNLVMGKQVYIDISQPRKMLNFFLVNGEVKFEREDGVVYQTTLNPTSGILLVNMARR